MLPGGPHILLGVSGGISAYKSCELLRRMQDLGLQVTVIPTRSSLHFVGVATWEALSGREVPVELWNNVHQVPHISLAKSADAIVIAPATADLLAKVAAGLADDLLTNLLLASSVPTIFVPAMHSEMWNNAATQSNVKLLKSRGYIIVEPGSGKLTSGDVGIGRYPETSLILESVSSALALKSDLKGRKVLISSGGTQEAIDPVRFIGNHSSGKQGAALAYAAAARGADVTLVSANSTAPDIEGVKTIHVVTALEMLQVLQDNFQNCEILIMAAAVADVRPAQLRETKINKGELTQLQLMENPDITKELSTSKHGQVMVGFAAQTEPTIDEALNVAGVKLREKGLDFIYCNDVSEGRIFGSEITSGTVLDATGLLMTFSGAQKITLANYLLDLALSKLG